MINRRGGGMHNSPTESSPQVSGIRAALTGGVDQGNVFGAGHGRRRSMAVDGVPWVTEGVR